MSTPTNQEPILSFQDLDIRFTLRGQVLNAIRGISLDVYRGESLAIVGESGSGKSVFTKSAMGLLDANGTIAGGHIWYGGKDLTTFTREKEWLTVRGKEIAMVMQDPMTSLNPLKTVGDQILEAVLLHQDLKGEAAKAAAIRIISGSGIPGRLRPSSPPQSLRLPRACPPTPPMICTRQKIWPCFSTMA